MLFQSSLLLDVWIINSNKYLLEIVRLQEFTVIQEVSQMSHKPPVAQGNAVFEASKKKKKTKPTTAKECARFSTGISYQYRSYITV